MFFYIAFLALSLFSNSMLFSNPLEYQILEENLTALTTNPLQALKAFEQHLTLHKSSLTTQERELLIKHLEAIKKELCTRPSTGMITLPLLATLYFAFNAFMNHLSIESRNNIPFIFFIDNSKLHDEFIFNFLASLIGLGTTILVNIEYHQSVKQLFKKEWLIETKINSMIEDLQAD